MLLLLLVRFFWCADSERRRKHPSFLVDSVPVDSLPISMAATPLAAASSGRACDEEELRRILILLTAAAAGGLPRCSCVAASSSSYITTAEGGRREAHVVGLLLRRLDAENPLPKISKHPLSIQFTT